ncbi:type II secretion system protein N [uncultured Brevundimonas sp.]|uniref:type II secretion system protein N n=1 Tax=uncultured Brevundimonas sp. TaxID=213418 RepID=UPI0025E4143D|nr:type II secretion system protein N [uncultured Brevundimonas sp.]
MIRRPLSAQFWIRLATLAAVTSVGVALAHVTWRLTGWDDGRSRIETPDRLPPVGGGDGGVTAILALAPFGGGAASVGAAGLPPTSLGLVLKGVILAASPEASTALIAVGEAAPRSFSVGESPLGSAVIEGIELDVVVLNVGGRREALTFPRLVSGSPAAPGAPTSTPTVAAPPGAEAAAAPAAASPIAAAVVASSGGGAPAGQDARPPAAPANPAAALQSAGVSATSEGYRLGPDAPAQLLRAGLRPGDLIRSLNGRPVADLASDGQLFERAAAAGSARVEIVRDGRTLTLTFPLR